MHHALTSPVYRSVAVAGLLLALSAARAATPQPTRRLVLHAVDVPGDVYLSAWRHGDLRVAAHRGPLAPRTFHTRGWGGDGCRWLGTETLEPIDGRSYLYVYSETILDCDAGATPYLMTPRTGVVTVED